MSILENLNLFFINFNYFVVLSDVVNLTTGYSYFFFDTIFLFKTFLLNLTSFCELNLNIQLSTNMKDALFMALKFLVCIALLIFARGGIPRFRFDYLTKLGWIRFLSLVLLSFLIEILILSMF